jgi:hypothetical protein
MVTAADDYPVHLDFTGPLEIARWRPLINWLLSFFTVLFTTQIPRPIFDMIVMTYRYEWRTFAFALWMTERYPPFSFMPQSADDGLSPASVSIDPPETLNRWLPLVKWFLAIPHYVVLVALVIGGVFVGIAAFFAVLVTGRYPQGLRDYLVGVNRYRLRVESYVFFLTDRYPPFRLR